MQINTLKYNRFGGYIINGVISCPLTGSEFDEEITAWLLTNTPEEADPEPPLDETAVAQAGAKAWYISTPNAALLFDLSIDGLVAEIDSLDLTALPVATRNKLKLLLKTLSVAVRVLAKQQGLT